MGKRSDLRAGGRIPQNVHDDKQRAAGQRSLREVARGSWIVKGVCQHLLRVIFCASRVKIFASAKRSKKTGLPYRGGMERHLLTQVVAPGLAMIAQTAGDAGLESDPVPNSQAGHLGPHLGQGGEIAQKFRSASRTNQRTAN